MCSTHDRNVTRSVKSARFNEVLDITHDELPANTYSAYLTFFFLPVSLRECLPTIVFGRSVNPST